jgi:hypothetical protein
MAAQLDGEAGSADPTKVRLLAEGWGAAATR